MGQPFWIFIDDYKNRLIGQYRMSIMLRTLEKMDINKKTIIEGMLMNSYQNLTSYYNKKNKLT